MGLATLIRYSLAAIALLAAHASSANDPLPGHFLDPAALLEHRTDAGDSPLLAGIKPPRLEPRTTFEAYQVSSSMLLDEQDRPAGFLVIVKGTDGAFTALVNTPERSGVVIGKADGNQTFSEQERMDEQANDYVDAPHASPPAEAASPAAADDQEHVLTVLAGFSEAAVQRVGDPKAFALAQIETLNLALRNTGITNIRVSLSGIATTPIDYVVNGENLAKIKTVFPNHPKADLIAGFFASQPQGAVGIAYRHGEESMTLVSTTDTFAHEIGHNIAGKHCSEPDGDYAHGHWTGAYSTLMCIKHPRLLAFSNPEKLAPDGKPTGDAKTADMARAWRTYAPDKSSGEGNDAEKPVLLYSLVDTEQCVAVDGTIAPRARVGLKACDPNSPNQRWNKLYVDGKVQFWLAARPNLCLNDEPSGGSQRDLIVSETGCEHIVWTEENRSLKLMGNGEYLYLFRSRENTLTVTARVPSDASPGFDWTTRYPYQRILNQDTGLCLEIKDGNYASGTPIVFSRCVDNAPAQRWIWESAGRFHSGAARSLCLGRTGSAGNSATLLDCNGNAADVVWKRPNDQITTDALRPLCLHALSYSQPGSRPQMSLCNEATLKGWLIQADR